LLSTAGKSYPSPRGTRIARVQDRAKLKVLGSSFKFTFISRASSKSEFRGLSLVFLSYSGKKRGPVRVPIPQFPHPQRTLNIAKTLINMASPLILHLSNEGSSWHARRINTNRITHRVSAKVNFGDPRERRLDRNTTKNTHPHSEVQGWSARSRAYRNSDWQSPVSRPTTAWGNRRSLLERQSRQNRFLSWERCP